MATVFREPNQVKWIGVRPGHNGEQVVANNNCTNVLTVVYTVPAGKIFLFFGFVFTTYHGAATNAQLMVYNAVPALENTLAAHVGAAGPPCSTPKSFDPPLEYGAGYTIRILGSAATVTVNAMIHGILIDA